MPDTFPEAFRRFERWYRPRGDLKDVVSFEQLLFLVKEWGQNKVLLSKTQVEAIRIEAKDRGLPYEFRRELRIKFEDKKPEGITLADKIERKYFVKTLKSGTQKTYVNYHATRNLTYNNKTYRKGQFLPKSIFKNSRDVE